MRKILYLFIILAMLFCTGADYKNQDKLSKNESGITFSTTVEKLMGGATAFDTVSLLEKLKEKFIWEIKSSLTTFTTVFSVSVFFSVVVAMGQGIGRYGVGEVAFFAVYSVICVVLFRDFSVFYTTSVSAIDAISIFLNSSIPIMGTAMVSGGCYGAYTAMTPVILATASLGANLIKSIGIPAVMMSLSLGVVGSMSEDFPLAKTGRSIRGGVLWLISGVLSIFCALIGISGIGAGGFNGALMRGVKIAASNLIPILGSVLSESAEAVMVGGVLFKNAIGTAALFMILLMAIYPVLKVCAAVLIYKVLAAVISPFADERVCTLINDISGTLSCFIGFIAAEGVIAAVAMLSLVGVRGVV